MAQSARSDLWLAMDLFRKHCLKLQQLNCATPQHINVLELLIGMQDNADRVVVWDYSLPLQQHKQGKLYHRVLQTGE